STGVRRDGDGHVLDGELTLKGVTREVPLVLELNGFGPDAYGGTRAGVSGTAEINRRDFGGNFAAGMETGGAVGRGQGTIQRGGEGAGGGGVQRQGPAPAGGGGCAPARTPGPPGDTKRRGAAGGPPRGRPRRLRGGREQP